MKKLFSIFSLYFALVLSAPVRSEQASSIDSPENPRAYLESTDSPTGTPTVVPTYTPTYGPRPTPTETPVITPTRFVPTPTPTPPTQCQAYGIDFNISAANKSSHVQIKQDGVKLSCFETVVNNALASSRAAGATGLSGWGSYTNNLTFDKSVGNKGHVAGGVLTSQIWEHLKIINGLKGAVSFNETDTAKLLADNTRAQQAINCTGSFGSVVGAHGMWQFGGAFSGTWNKLADGCNSGTLYLDKDCKFVIARDLDKTNLCGSMSYIAQIATPISLVWGDSHKTTSSTLVNFKLNPYSDNSVWLWRGSEELPLLVYDPEHKGNITSATQLFGSWTFGGNGLASMLEGEAQGTPWRDGYEALSKMDKNLDGKVSGSELKDLGLWFDKNQDGISQEGEVKTLTEVSVTALYYHSDRKEEGALVATKGYEREVDGKSILASSMDWYEKGLRDGYDVAFDAIKESDGSVTVEAEDKDIAKDIAKDIPTEVFGAWGWTLDLPAKGSGFMTFDATEDGFEGITLSQRGISGSGAVDSQIAFSYFQGKSIKNSEGVDEIKFNVDGGNGKVIKNSALLSKNGSELIGKTVVKGSSLSGSGTYEYSWKAVRLK